MRRMRKKKKKENERPTPNGREYVVITIDFVETRLSGKYIRGNFHGNHVGPGKDRTIMPPRDLTPFATCLIAIFSIAVCQTNCPATCLCHLDQIPSTVMCAGQGLDAFPGNMSDLVWANLSLVDYRKEEEEEKECINFRR